MCSHYNSSNLGTKNSKRAIKTNVSANLFFQLPQSVLLEPNASISQDNEASDIMICDNLSLAISAMTHLHILEKHCVNLMRAHRFGMGFHGEREGKCYTL